MGSYASSIIGGGNLSQFWIVRIGSRHVRRFGGRTKKALRSPESLTRIWNLRYDLDIEFEWDEAKATANLTKHGVSFEEAKTVFNNVLAVIFDDEAHSVSEKREIIIRHSRNNRLLLISFTERSNAIRIISARLATRREREDYEQNAF